MLFQEFAEANVRALRLAHSAGRILLYGPMNSKILFDRQIVSKKNLEQI